MTGFAETDGEHLAALGQYGVALHEATARPRAFRWRAVLLDRPMLRRTGRAALRGTSAC